MTVRYFESSEVLTRLSLAHDQDKHPDTPQPVKSLRSRALPAPYRAAAATIPADRRLAGCATVPRPLPSPPYKFTHRTIHHHWECQSGEVPLQEPPREAPTSILCR
jgi:hypothetical protein